MAHFQKPISLMVVAFATLSAGCLGSSDTDEFKFGSGIFEASALQGSWATKCYTVSPRSGFHQYSFKETLTFVGATLTITDVLYSDSYCSIADFTQQIVSGFVAGDASPTNSHARTIDLTMSLMNTTPNSVQGANDLNGASMCGLTNWSSGTSTDMLGRSCAGSTVNAGSKIYGIVQIGDYDIFTGTTSGTNELYLGSTFGSSASTRATSLDMSTVYTKL